jgi:hypothetical protein
VRPTAHPQTDSIEPVIDVTMQPMPFRSPDMETPHPSLYFEDY